MCPCAGEALGKSSLLPVPYDAILKEPGCVVAHGLPDGVGLKKPCEYDTKTLMKILEQSHRIQFSVSRRVCGTNAETGSRSSSSSLFVFTSCLQASRRSASRRQDQHRCQSQLCRRDNERPRPGQGCAAATVSLVRRLQQRSSVQLSVRHAHVLQTSPGWEAGFQSHVLPQPGQRQRRRLDGGERQDGGQRVRCWR